jgi:hypothetical protein
MFEASLSLQLRCDSNHPLTNSVAGLGMEPGGSDIRQDLRCCRLDHKAPGVTWLSARRVTPTANGPLLPYLLASSGGHLSPAWAS